MEHLKTVPKINAKSSPPVPIKTYRWEDIRREKKRGKYPYTYLYKRPFFANIMDEDEVKPVNGEKKKKIVKKIKKVVKKKPSQDEEIGEVAKIEDTSKGSEETKEAPMEVEEIKTDPKIYARRNDSPTGDWWNEESKTEDTKAEEATKEIKVEDTEADTSEVKIVATRNDSPVDWWTEDTKDDTKISSGDEIKTDLINKSDSRTPSSEDTYTESNIDQYLDKEEVSKSDASGAGGTTSASDAELPQDLKAQSLDIGEKRKHSDPSEMTQSNLSLFEKMKNSKFKPPTFKIPKLKRFNFSKKSSKRIKTDAKDVAVAEVLQEATTIESPVYIRIPLNPTAEELELERQESRQRLADGSNRLNNVDTNGNISSSSSRPASPEKSTKKTTTFKKSGVKSTKKVSPKSEKRSTPKKSPPLSKKGPLLTEESKVESGEEELDFTLRTPTTNGAESTDLQKKTSPNVSPRGTLKSSPRGSPKGALKKKAKLKESTQKLTKDIKKMASKLKEVQDKTKKSFTTKKTDLTSENKTTEHVSPISTTLNEGPVEYIFIPLSGPLPDNLVKKSTEDLNSAETPEPETIELGSEGPGTIDKSSEPKKDSLMSKLKGKPKVEKKETPNKLEQTPKSLDMLVAKRSGDSPPVEYIHIPLTPTEEELEKEFVRAKELDESQPQIDEAAAELPSTPKPEKSGTEILKDTSKLVSTPLLLALESQKIKPQKSVKIKEEPKEGFMNKLKVLTSNKLESVITPPVIEETAKKLKGFTYSIKRKLDKEEPKVDQALTDKALDSLIQQREESPPIDYYQIPVRPTAAELERLAQASKEEPWETEEGFEIIPNVENKKDEPVVKTENETVITDKEAIALEESEAMQKQTEAVEKIKESSTPEDTSKQADVTAAEEKKEEPAKPKLKLQKQKSQAPAIPQLQTPELEISSSEPDSATTEIEEIKTVLKDLPSEDTKAKLKSEDPTSLTTIVTEIIPKTTTEVVLLKELPSTSNIEPSSTTPKLSLLEEPKTPKLLKLTEFTKSTSSLLGPVKEETKTKLKGFTSSIKRKLGKEEPKLEHKLTDHSLDSLIGKRETTPPIDYYAIPVRPTAAELERLAQQSKEEPWETEEGFEVITVADCADTTPVDEVNKLNTPGLEDAMEEVTEVQTSTVQPAEEVLAATEDVPKKKTTVMEKIKSVKPDLRLSMKKKAPKKSSPTSEMKMAKRSPPVDKRRRDSPVEYLHISLNPTAEELAAEKEKEIQKRLDEAPEVAPPVEATVEELPKIESPLKKGAVKKQPGEKSKLQDTTAKLTQDIKKFAAKLKDMQKKAKKPTFKTFKHGTKVGSKKLSPPTTKKAVTEGKRSPPRSQDSMESPEYIFIPLTGPLPKEVTNKSAKEETLALIQTTTTEHSLSSKTSSEEAKAPEKLVRKKSKSTTTAIDSLKKTKDYSITKLKALKDAVQPPKKSEATPETPSVTKTEIAKQGSLESPEYIVIPLKDPSDEQTKDEDTKDEELESIFFEKMKLEEPVKSKKKKKVPKPPLSKEDSVRSVDEPIEVDEVPVLEEASKLDIKTSQEVLTLVECPNVEDSKPVEAPKSVEEVQKSEEPHHYEPISKEDEEDGLKTAVLASKVQDEVMKSTLKPDDSPKMNKKVQFKKKKGLKTPSEDDSVIYETIQVQADPSPSVQNAAAVTKSVSVEDEANWSKSIDHEYEPINPPPEPVPSPPQSRPEPLKDLKLEEPLPPEPRLLRIPLDNEVIQPPEDLEVQSSRRSLVEEDHSTPDLQSRRSYMNTPDLSSRTDGINTSQVDSSALEMLPLKKEARTKQPKKEDVEDENAAPSMQSKIKTQAGKLKTKLKSIKRPTFAIPNPKFSPKFRRPKSGPKTQGAKIQKPKFQRPKFKMPDAPKFSMPQMPQMPTMPNMPKMPTFASMRRQSAPQTEEKQTTESSLESKPNIFDFRTYPRLFDKTKKKTSKTATMSATTDESAPDFATVPRAAARKKGPVGARWVHRFSDIQYADDEKPTPGDDLRSKDRGDSLERRMEADLRYEEALAEDEEFRDYERENQELNRRSHPVGPDGEYPERWRHGNFRNPDSFDEDLPNGMDEQQRNRIGYEIQEQQRLEEMRRQHMDEHSSVASSGHHRGVLEEIDSDQFFLREKGISQDNIQVGLYLSSEIRDAFRQPVNSLTMHRDYDASDLSLTRPSRPKRKHFKKSKKAKKTPHASQEEMYDRDSINTEPEEYPKNLNNFKTYPPPRPKRNKRSRSQAEAEVDDEINLDAQNFQSQDDVSNEMESMPNILGYVEKDSDIIDEYNKYINDEALMYENEVMKDIEQPEIVISGDQKYEITKKDIDRYLQETGMVSTPKPPTRRHRSMKSLAMSDHDSIIGEFNRDKRMQDMLEQELNVYRVEHLPVEDSPLAPARRSRSRTLSQLDDDRTSHGAESLRSECQESPCQEERRDSMGYAIIDKKKLQDPPLPKRRRSTKSNRSETKFFTVPRQLNDTSPARPTRNYTTLGEPNRLKRSETDLTADEDEKENIDISQYIEIEDDDHAKNLHSGEVINKMKGRPLPAPPRPPRSRRDRSKDALRDITQESNIISDQIGDEKISHASPSEPIEEIEMSTQTDPLPEDFGCDEVDEPIVPPTRRKRSSQRDSSRSLDRPEPQPFRTPIDSPIPRRKLRSRDSSFSRSQDRPAAERSLSPTERRRLRSRDTSFSRSLDRPKTPSDLSRTPIERSLSPTERRRLKSRNSSFSRSLDRPKTPIEGSSSPNAMVIQSQVHTPIEDETVTHASLLVRPVAEYPADSFVSKRFAADISYDMMEETMLRKAKPDFDAQLDLEIREATSRGLESRATARRDLDFEAMRRDLEISDEDLNLTSQDELASEYFETAAAEPPEVRTSKSSESSTLTQQPQQVTKEKSPDYSEIIRRETTDELTEMPEKPQRRKSSAKIEPHTKQEVLQTPPEPQIIERIIERQVPVVPGPETEVEILKAHRLQVTDLDVERLTVSELQAHKILVSEIDGVSLTINELSSKSGNLVLNGLEIPSGLIQEILDRLQPAAAASERPPSEQVATQTSIDEPTESEIFTDPIRTEQVCTQTSVEVVEPTPMEQVATQTSLDEPDDSKVPEEFQQLRDPVILIDTATETDQDEQQELLENLKYRIRFIEEELNDLSTDITQEEINALKLEINDIIEIASEQVLGQMDFRQDDEPLEYIQIPGLITESSEAGAVEHEILIDANLLRSLPVDELEDMLIRTLSGEARLVPEDIHIEEETRITDEASVENTSEASLTTVEETTTMSEASGEARLRKTEESRPVGEARFTVELVEEPEQKRVEVSRAGDSIVPKEFLQLKSEQEQIIESFQPKEEKTLQQVTVPQITTSVPEPIETIPPSKEQEAQQPEVRPTTPQKLESQIESSSPPSRPPLPQLEPQPPQSELLHGIPYPVSYYPEYVRSIPPQSFYTLRSPPQHELSEDDIPVHHRRRRHHRHQSRSSSEEDRRTISRRHTARSPEPSIPHLSSQLARACSHSFGRFLRQITNEISTLFGGPREGKYDMQVALVILLVLVAGLMLLGFGGGKTVHLHHWEFFNPPKEL